MGVLVVVVIGVRILIGLGSLVVVVVVVSVRILIGLGSLGILGILSSLGSLVVVIGVGVGVGIVIVIVVVVSSRIPDSKLRAVVRRTTLCNRHENKLMVGRGSHSANAVVASGKPPSDSRREPAIAITCIVNSLEECELSGIERSRRVQGVAEILDSDVGVADDLTTLKLLGSRVVGVIGVGEGSSNEVGHLNFDIEGRVGRDGITALCRECDYGGDHVVFGGDISHDCLALGKADLISWDSRVYAPTPLQEPP